MSVPSLGQLIDDLAARRQRRPALYFGKERYSFIQLADDSRRAAAGLAALGIGKGDRVAVWLPNVFEWLVLHVALARLGAIAVAVNTRFRSMEVADIVGRSGARALVLWPGFKNIDFMGILAGADPAAFDRLETLILCRAGTTLPSLPLDRPIVRFDDLFADEGLHPDIGTADDGALIFITSGTTRAPKFVLHAQRSLTAHALDVARAFGYDAPGTVLLQALPLCGTFGHAQMLGALAAGAPSVLMETFDAGEAARLIRDNQVTQWNGTDEMFLRVFDAAGPDDLVSLRACGFASFNPALGDVVAAGDSLGVAMHGLYGMSEVQALYARQPSDAPPEIRALAGGRLTAPDAAARVRDPESGELLPPGENGELELRGPSLMAGYFCDDDATRDAFTEDGFVRTGDLGHVTEDGGFVFLARMGDVLRLGGFLVSPAEIEAHIEALPAVAACQIVGVTTPEGPRTAAFVIPADGAAFDAAAIRNHCAARLAKFKVPAAIFPIAAFPTTDSPNGVKIQRGKLREMAEAKMRTNAD